ncbi:hypothetical protein V5799_029766 [Amblyomma americanum]|uniref:Uncharacterized protein n=1 Tax=Amblyomma americanum TaxID=6943 RepID=A0AAQ4EQ73_AMBAM
MQMTSGRGTLHSTESTGAIGDVQNAILGSQREPAVQPHTTTRDIPKAEFQRQVLRQLHVNRLMLEQVLDLVTHMPTVRAADRSEAAPVLILKPFKELKNFMQFDKNLENVKEELVRFPNIT